MSTFKEFMIRFKELEQQEIECRRMIKSMEDLNNRKRLKCLNQ